MSNMLKVSEEIEEKLKNANLVGSRLGSGFSFIGNSRDVQFNYLANIEKVVNEVLEKYDDLRASFAYRLDNFSFYISPKRKECECKCDEEVCEDECCVEDNDSKSSLTLHNNRAKILLNVINYGLTHMTLTADDRSELSGIQEEIVKYTEKDK